MNILALLILMISYKNIFKYLEADLKEAKYFINRSLFQCNLNHFQNLTC